MLAILRIVGGVVAGIVTAIALLIAVEFYSAVVHPFPEGVEQTHEEICAHVASYPAWILATAVPMWGFTAFASVWVAARIGNRWGGLLVGALFFVAIAANLAMLPYPVWFKIAMPVVILIAATLALFSAERRRPAAGADATEADRELEATSLSEQT